MNELDKYMKLNFPKLKICKPLFYNWEVALRFEMGLEEDLDENYKCGNTYFNQINKKASDIYNHIFSNDDEIYLIYQTYLWRKRRIKKNNYILNQINRVDYNKLSINKIDTQYQNDGYTLARVDFLLKKEDVNHSKIFDWLAKLDFSGKVYQNKDEVYFINKSKNIIFNLYDDRGLDVIAKDKSDLSGLYKDFNSYILDYDREKIDNIFTN